ncbi:MAG: hypothetical protein KF809_14990 [Chloroflexi bacterium]|nr:hypothetical protein [Chloroflexota bacterium]
MSTHVHRFTRLLSTAGDGRQLWGCEPAAPVTRCDRTEIRRPNEPSPFAVARAKRRMAARERRWKGERTHA